MTQESLATRLSAVALIAMGGMQLTGCSGASLGVTDPSARETALTHEPCEAGSEQAQRIDANSDGRPDITRLMANGKEQCRILDLNFDGQPDAFVYFDEAGRERRRESDYDRDGKTDEIIILRTGAVIEKERETNFDAKIDTWDYYDVGRLVRRERDSDGDGVIDQWWQFNRPGDDKCAIVLSDKDLDGKPDQGSDVDLCAAQQGATAEGSAAPATPAGAAPSASASSPPTSEAPEQTPAKPEESKEGATP